MPYIGGGSIGLNSIVNAEASAESSEEEKKDLFDSKSESFYWVLFENRHDTLTINTGNSGFGSIASIPYSDQVIVLLPTLDVRLISMKIPLVNDEKLRLILPGLLEEHLLSGVDQFEIQIIRPFDDAPALERTVAAIDKSWLEWLSRELSGLVSPHVRLIPDCFLLKPIRKIQQLGSKAHPDQGEHSNQAIQTNQTSLSSQANQPSIAFDTFDNQLVWTVRLGEQTGASWVDQIDSESSAKFDFINPELLAYLPSYLQTETIASYNLDSDWVKSEAYRFVSDSSNDGINLLPESFKPMGLKNSRINLDHRDAPDVSQKDKFSWGTTKKLSIYFLLSIFISYVAFALILTVIDWVWKSQMNAMATPYIQKLSISKNQGIKTSSSANQLKVDDQDNSHVSQFINELNLKKRKNGLSSQGDFPEMASELYRLMSSFGNQTVKSLEYKNSSIEFVVDEKFLESNHISTNAFISKAVSMGIAITSQGDNHFRLLPYAGLGVK